jgi:hypothetical protein
VNREQAKEIVARIIAKAITETDHASLEVGDLVFSSFSDRCLKIQSVNGNVATVLDGEKEYLCLLSDLAHSEAVRWNYCREMYGPEKVIVVGE